jgi:hypothetical protein
VVPAAVTAERHEPSDSDDWEDGAVPRHGGDGRAVWTRAAVTAWKTPRFPCVAVTAGR